MLTLSPRSSKPVYTTPRRAACDSLRAHERQSAADKAVLFERVRQVAVEEFPEAKVTGLFVLLANLLESLMHDQWVDLAVAAVGLITLMTIAYRSVYLGLVSLLPNVLPILCLLGGMGWAGIPVTWDRDDRQRRHGAHHPRQHLLSFCLPLHGAARD